MEAGCYAYASNNGPIGGTYLLAVRSVTEERSLMQRTSVRVGQRLINWDGTKGYVALKSQGTRVIGPGEPFLVEWLGFDGKTMEDAAYFTLEDLEREGITFGKSVMRWAK